MTVRDTQRSRNLTSLLPAAAAGLIAVVVLALSALAVRARTEAARPAEAGSTALAASPVSMRAARAVNGNADPKQRMGVLVVKLRRTGFEPSELTRPRGRFLLAFDNQSGADEIILRLQHETGNKLHEVHMPRGSVRWRQALDLHPGRYLLSVNGHPEWICHLTITAN